MAESLGANFSIDVTNLKAGLAQANRLIKESQSEFKAAAAGMDDWSSSQEGLTAKLKSLNQIAEVQQKKVDALNQEYERLIDNGMEPTSKEAVELRTKINNETAALEKSKSEIDKQTQALEDLENQTDDAGDATDDMGDSFSGLKAAGGVAAGAVAAVAAATVAAVGAFLSLAESTREARTNMAKLETGFSQAGFSAETAVDTYNELYSVLGDDGQATEAAAHLAQLADSQEDLATWTDIATGVYATFGDSLPIEGLTEAANETAKTGAITGGLADALNWAGVSEDEFQASLDACTSEQERQALITNTLNGLYADSAAAYRENNAEVIAAQKAQAELNGALSELGAIAEPIMTMIKTLAADVLTSITPFVGLIGEGLTGALTGADGAAESFAEGMTGIVNAVVGMASDMLPTVTGIIAELIPSLLSSLLSQVPTLLSAVLSIGVQLVGAVTQMLPQILAQISALLPQIVTLLISYIPTLLQAATQLLLAIVDALPVVIQNLTAALPSVVSTICDVLIQSIPILIDAAVQLLFAIVDAIPQLISSLESSLPEIIVTIISAVLDAYPVLIDAAITLLFALIDAIPQIVSSLNSAMPRIIVAIVSAVTNALPKLFSAAKTLFSKILDAISNLLTQLPSKMASVIKTIVSGITSGVSQLFSAAKTLFAKVTDAASSLISQMPAKMASVVSSIVTGLRNGISKVRQIGQDIISGLWNGISDMTSWIAGKIQSFGDSVLSSLKSFFGIASPSKLMADEVGKNLALGVGVGWENAIKGVNKDINSSLNIDTASVGKGLTAANKTVASATSGVTVNQTNYYAQTHSRRELWKSKEEITAAVKLVAAGV